MGKIILIRHGYAYNQELNLLSGDMEFPLTLKGIKQASLLSKNKDLFHADKIFCSTVLRCKETVKHIYGDVLSDELLIEYTDLLREINTGDLGYMKYPEFEEKEEFEDFGFSSKVGFPNGETFNEFKSRVEKIYDIIDFTKTNVIVSHSGVINILLHNYYKIDFTKFPFFNVKNCRPYILEVNC